MNVHRPITANSSKFTRDISNESEEDRTESKERERENQNSSEANVGIPTKEVALPSYHVLRKLHTIKHLAPVLHLASQEKRRVSRSEDSQRGTKRRTRWYGKPTTNAKMKLSINTKHEFDTSYLKGDCRKGRKAR